MGVTYYKLEQRYEGDKTKGCGLTTAEMDENIHFLRGYDIRDAWLTDDGILILERVNCDQIVVSGIPEFVKSIAEETMEEYDVPFSLSGTSYDSRTGTLTIMVNGEPYEISGFEDTDLEFKLYVGYGLDGNGTIANPVRVAHVNDTGFLAPVEKILDEGEELPTSNVSGSRRYITKEKKSPYGLLYTAEDALLIDEWLQENARGWRLPTLDEWNEMLNALECNDEDRNHGLTGETSNNGAVAALYLKAEEFDDDPELNEFNALPTQRIGSTLVTSFWTRTPGGEGSLYAKELQQEEDKVLNRRSGRDNLDLRAIRLIKDAGFNSYNDEEINGAVYKTTPMDAYKDGHVYATNIWLAENLRLEDVSGITGTEPYGYGFYFANEDEYNQQSTFHYFINEWDPYDRKWMKRELRENDILIINDFDGSGNPMEVIVKLDDEGNQVFEPHFKDIYETIAEVSARTDSAITAEEAAREAADEELSNTIDALSAGTESAITEEIAEREAADDALSDRIDTLSSAVTSEVTEIREAIDEVNSALTEYIDSAVTALNETIDALSAETQDAISDLQEQADELSNNGINYDEQIVEMSSGKMTITSKDGNSELVREFSLDMGEFSISGITI